MGPHKVCTRGVASFVLAAVSLQVLYRDERLERLPQVSAIGQCDNRCRLDPALPDLSETGPNQATKGARLLPLRCAPQPCGQTSPRSLLPGSAWAARDHLPTGKTIA